MKYLLPVMALIVLFSCNEKKAARSEKPPSLPVIQLYLVDTTMDKHYVAAIQAYQNVELRAKTTGYIEQILVDEGSQVKKGQLLFVLNDEEFETGMAQASAALSNAKAEATAAELDLQRVKMLVDKNIISKTEFELGNARVKSAHAKVDEYQSRLKNAQIRLSYTRIRAPYDGVIDRIPFKVGSLVNEGSLLTTVSDLSAMYAYFNVSEFEYLHYMRSVRENGGRQQREVSLQLVDGSSYPHKGKIETMDSEFDEATGSIAFRARFPNPQKMLKHGASGRISLETKLTDALIVPMKSVFEIQDKNYVFVVESDSTVTLKSFEPQARLEEYIIVKTGLSANDKIVYEGIQNIKDGTLISPQMVPMERILTYSPN